MKALLSKSEKRRHRERARIKSYIFGGAAVLGLTLVAHFFLNANFFRIKSVEISGIVNFEEARAEVLSRVDGRLLGFSNFLAWPGHISGVDVDKNYADGILKLSGPNADQFAIWCALECYWVNHDGIAVAEAPDTEGGAIAKVSDSRKLRPIIGEPVLADGRFAAIAGLISGLGSLPVTISAYHYDADLQELTATPSRGAKLIFSVRFSPSDKLFASLLNLINSGQIRNSVYADFTVEHRVYLK